MRKHVGLKVSGLGKSLVAVVKWTYVRTVTCVNPDVRAQIEVQ